MKLLLITIFLLTGYTPNAKDPYHISLSTIEGEKLDLADWKGRKIIIAAFDAFVPDPAFFQYIDSLQSEEKNTRVIAFPALDFQGKKNVEKMQDLKDSLKMKIVIAEPAYIKKESRSKQHPLFSWITNVSQNDHFDIEIEEPNQIFIISPKGTLYACLRPANRKHVVNQVIADNTIE